MQKTNEISNRQTEMADSPDDRRCETEQSENSCTIDVEDDEDEKVCIQQVPSDNPHETGNRITHCQSSDPRPFYRRINTEPGSQMSPYAAAVVSSALTSDIVLSPFPLKPRPSLHPALTSYAVGLSSPNQVLQSKFAFLNNYGYATSGFNHLGVAPTPRLCLTSSPFLPLISHTMTSLCATPSTISGMFPFQMKEHSPVVNSASPS